MNNKVNPLTLMIFSSTTLVMLVLLDGIFLNMLFNLFNSYIMLALFASIAFSVFPLLYLFRWRKNYTIWYSSPKKKRCMDRRSARRGVEKKQEGYKDDLL